MLPEKIEKIEKKNVDNTFNSIYLCISFSLAGVQHSLKSFIPNMIDSTTTNLHSGKFIINIR